MMRAQDESIAFVAEHDVVGLWPHPQSVHSGPHRAPRTTRNKRGRKPLDNIELEWWPFSSLLEIAERRDAQAARRRMRSPMRSTARLIAAYACCPHARVRREPEGTSATVTAQATVSHVPLRLSRRRTTRAPRTCCVCWARAANTLYSAYVRACALLDSSSPITSIRMGSIGSSAPGPLQYSCDALHHEGHRALFSGGKGQATYGAALPGARIGSCLPRDFGTPVNSVSNRNIRLQNEIWLEAAGRADWTLRAEPVLLHFAPQRDGADLQRLRGLAPVPAETFQCALDHGAFLCLKVEAVVGRAHTSLL